VQPEARTHAAAQTDMMDASFRRSNIPFGADAAASAPCRSIAIALLFCEPLMTTKPSERIVVFVTPAQKLAISNTAESLGISVSELMRRAVLNFNATSEQIKVAGIVDRLRAPKAPDPLDAALRSVAQKAAAREARAAAVTATAQAAAKKTVLKPASPIEAEEDSDGGAGEDAPLAGGRRST
jgi:hypothetical protein